MFPSKKKNVDDISKDFSENRKLNGCNNMSNSEYIIYICPLDWKMINLQYNRDFYQYFIIDKNNIKRIGIRGNWQATYHKESSLTILESKLIELLDNSNMSKVNVTDINLIGEFVKPCGIKINNICT
jgi:hypothetical protein